MEDLLKVGIITSTHGIKGEVKVFPTTDDVKRFKKGIRLILETGKERLELEVEGVKFFKQFVILKFKGIDDINQIEKYKRKELFVTREHAVKLKKDEYFIADLIGLSVIDEQGTVLGVLEDVMETGANDVYIVKMEDEKEVLIPAIKQCILEVNVEEGFVKVHMMEGLL
ncbi:MAG: ribosome maturation factor RimM [Roseburia sp.]|nr:ribosome maturation factor RimM [Roseburia sp.]MCM1278931.1 ribosome maturation factor RimM [Robinsoniella sp.]